MSDFDDPFDFELDYEHGTGTVVVADMSTGPIILGTVPHPPLSRETITGIALGLAASNAGRPPGLWVMEDCPVSHEAVTIRATFGAG